MNAAEQLIQLRDTAQAAYIGVAAWPAIAKRFMLADTATLVAVVLATKREEIADAMEAVEHLLDGEPVKLQGIVGGISEYPSACAALEQALTEWAIVAVVEAELAHDGLPRDTDALASALTAAWQDKGIPAWVSDVPSNLLRELADVAREECNAALRRLGAGAAEPGEGQGDDGESKLASSSAALAVLADNADHAIMEIVASDESCDLRMKKIAAIDSRFIGKRSMWWAELLGRTPQAIRDTTIWKEWQRQKRVDE